MNKISILLSIYNGRKYIKELLYSLFTQTYKNIEVIVRDDGSSYSSLDILQSYDIKLLKSNKNLGAKGSFAELSKYALENSDSEYFIFCDQDDVWKADKVEKTLLKMQELEKMYGKNIPLLVHTDLEVVNESLETISNSMWEHEKINPELNSLNRLLIHNTITGCTMMINRNLAKMCLAIPKEAIMHDWWMGLVASTFGKIGYINDATIKYRQHSKNDTGTRKYSLRYIINRFKKFDDINIDKNIAQAKQFLILFDNKLDKDTKKMLEDFTSIKTKPYYKRVFILFKYDLFKYGFFRNIGLILKI